MIQLFSIPQNLSEEQQNKILEENKTLLSLPGIFLKTCNRMEFYYGEGQIPVDIFFHLCRVVSGLNSNLLGENAIQGQVKQAYIEASNTFSLSAELHFLFQKALYIGKKVRTNSDISKGAVSHSQATTEIIARSGIPLNNAIISLIGAHKLNEDIIKFLKNKGAETFFMANKTFEKAQQLAEQCNGKAMKLNNLNQMLEFTDILISATSAPHYIVKPENIPAGKKMLVLDLANPADIDPLISSNPGITLFNLCKIEHFLNQNIEQRKNEITKAEAIIEFEISKLAASGIYNVHKKLSYANNS